MARWESIYGQTWVEINEHTGRRVRHIKLSAIGKDGARYGQHIEIEERRLLGDALLFGRTLDRVTGQLEHWLRGEVR